MLSSTNHLSPLHEENVFNFASLNGVVDPGPVYPKLGGLLDPNPVLGLPLVLFFKVSTKFQKKFNIYNL
jgi:hypothetical protein